MTLLILLAYGCLCAMGGALVAWWWRGVVERPAPPRPPRDTYRQPTHVRVIKERRAA